MRSFLVFVVFALSVFSAAGQPAPGRYIVELSTEPGKGARRSAAAAQQDTIRQAMAGAGVTIRASVATVANALIVEATPEQAEQLRTLPGVVHVDPVKSYKRMLDRAVLLQNVPDAWNRAGGEGRAGAGIKIAIVDSGIDSRHDAFRDESLPTLEGYPRVTNQSDLAFTNRKVIVARAYNGSSSALDGEGHGTAVAAVAAGGTSNGPQATITGIAHKAYLGNYKVFPAPNSGANTDGILQALDDAVNDGMDVINLSLGSFPAERPEQDVLARAIDRISAGGIVVVAAAGNEAPGLATISSPASAASAIAVGNSANDRIFATLASIDGLQPATALPGDGPVPNAPGHGLRIDVTPLDETGLVCAALPAGSLTNRIALISRGTCNFEDKIRFAEQAGALAALIYARQESPDPINMAVGTAALPAMMISYQSGVNARAQLAASGEVNATLSFAPVATAVDPQRLSSSSSRGPNSDLGVKPDLLAVGTSVYTAFPVTGGISRYAAVDGTSFSAPMVTGTAALLKQARPGLTADQYRSLLINSAALFTSSTGEAYPVSFVGTGRLDAGSALRSQTAIFPVSLSFGVTSGTINATRNVTITNLGSEPAEYTVAVDRLSGSIAPSFSRDPIRLEAGASGTLSVQLEASGLAPGSYSGYLVLSGARVPYWFGVSSESASELISVGLPEGPVRSGSRQTFFVRSTDAAGIPLNLDPAVSTVSGEGAVLSVRSVDSQYPGFFEIQVRVGMAPGANIFELQAGGQTSRVTITGR